MNNRKDLIDNIITLIIESLNLHHLSRDDINETTPLFNEGLALDSIDVLEIIVSMEEKYGVKIENSEQGKEVFASIGSIANFIESHKTRN